MTFATLHKNMCGVASIGKVRKGIGIDAGAESHKSQHTYD
jgi:hypothetical protein